MYMQGNLSNTSMSDRLLPPAYDHLSEERLRLGQSAEAPPPEYDFNLIVPAVAQTSRSRYVGPSAIDMATAAPPAYSAVADYPSHEELEEVMPVKKQSKIAAMLFRNGKVRRHALLVLLLIQKRKRTPRLLIVTSGDVNMAVVTYATQAQCNVQIESTVPAHHHISGPAVLLWRFMPCVLLWAPLSIMNSHDELANTSHWIDDSQG